MTIKNETDYSLYNKIMHIKRSSIGAYENDEGLAEFIEMLDEVKYCSFPTKAAYNHIYKAAMENLARDGLQLLYNELVLITDQTERNEILDRMVETSVNFMKSDLFDMDSLPSYEGEIEDFPGLLREQPWYLICMIIVV